MKKMTVIGSVLVVALVVALFVLPKIGKNGDEAGEGSSGGGSSSLNGQIKDLVPADYAPAVAERVTAAAEAAHTDKVLHIGVMQLGDNPALEDIYYGILDGMAAQGYFNGVNIEVDYKNANFDQNAMKTIADQFVADKKDIVIGIATAPAQALQNAFKGTATPVIFAGVTDPLTAKLVDSLENPGANVTGACMSVADLNAIALIKQIVPKAKTIGMLYTSSEPNSAAQVKATKPLAEAEGLTVIEKSISNTNDLAQTAEDLAGDVDAIYVGQDNAIAAAMPTLIAATDAHSVPVFPSSDAMVASGGVVTKNVNQYLWGVDAGYVAAAVLGGADPASYPVFVSEATDLYYNAEAAKKLGISLPDSLTADAINMAGKE